MKRLFLLALLLPLAACGPGISSVIDSTLTTGEAGLEQYSKNKALALSQAPCRIDMVGMKYLSTSKQFAIRMLCTPESPGPNGPIIPPA